MVSGKIYWRMELVLCELLQKKGKKSFKTQGASLCENAKMSVKIIGSNLTD